MPADAVPLRQRQRVGVVHREHAPEPHLEVARVHIFFQVVAQQGLELGKDLVKVFAGRLLRDAREDHAPAIRKQQLSLKRSVCVHQLRIGLHQVHQFHRVVPNLAHRAAVGHAAMRRLQLHLVEVRRDQGLPLPVFHFQQQHTPARTEDHEVGLAGLGADGDVMPDDVIVFQAALKLMQDTALAGVAALVDAGQALGEDRHAEKCSR